VDGSVFQLMRDGQMVASIGKHVFGQHHIEVIRSWWRRIRSMTAWNMLKSVL